MIYSKNFDIAYEELRRDESGYANVTGDRGGETYCGISYNFHPHWAGWAILAKYKPLKHGQIIQDPELERLLKEFYYQEYWLPVGAEQVDDLSTAKRLFNFGVTSGQRTSLKQLQATLNIPQTGIVDALTIEAVHNPAKFLA